MEIVGGRAAVLRRCASDRPAARAAGDVKSRDFRKASEVISQSLPESEGKPQPSPRPKPQASTAKAGDWRPRLRHLPSARRSRRGILRLLGYSPVRHVEMLLGRAKKVSTMDIYYRGFDSDSPISSAGNQASIGVC
jgi:hypothetical protein